jgi:hypothetical protein
MVTEELCAWARRAGRTPAHRRRHKSAATFRRNID